MDKDDKKNELEEKDKEEEKKDNKPITQDEQLKQLEDEIKNLLDDMKLVLGEEGVPDVKVISSKKISKKKLLLFQFIEVLLSIGILVGLTGYISWFRCDKLYYYFIVIGGMSILDFALSYIINRFFVRVIFYTFGLVMIVPAIVVFILSGLVIPLFGTIDIGRLILVAILYIVVKRLIMFFIKGNNSNFHIQTIKK